LTRRSDLELLADHLGNGESAAMSLAIDRSAELVRETNGYALHTCILASLELIEPKRGLP